MIYEHIEYRSYLKDILAERIRKNPAYSLRAMAKQLGLSGSTLCEVLKGKNHFSSQSTRKVIQGLGLNQEEADYFMLLVEYESLSQPSLKATVLEKLQKLNPQKNKIQNLSLDFFRRISEWYHSAILEMVFLDGFDLTPLNVAKKLGISSLDADLAIERLLRLGLLKKTKQGKLQRNQDHLLTKAKAPSDAFRKFYRQMLSKTEESLESQTPQERLSGYLTIPFNPKDLKKAEALLEKFFAGLIELSESSSPKTDVYHLGVHLFNLTPERKIKS